MSDDSTSYASCFTCAGTVVDSTTDVCDDIASYWLREVCELAEADGFVLSRAAGSCIVCIVTCKCTVYVYMLLWARGWFVYMVSLGLCIFAFIVAGGGGSTLGWRAYLWYLACISRGMVVAGAR